MSKKNKGGPSAFTEPAGPPVALVDPPAATPKPPAAVRLPWQIVRVIIPGHPPISFRIQSATPETARESVVVNVSTESVPEPQSPWRFVDVVQVKAPEKGFPGRRVTIRVRAETKQEAERLAREDAYSKFLFEPDSVTSCTMQER